MASDSQSLSLKPTLLNPGDTVSVTAITSGDPPIFQSKARIVGVTNAVLEDGTTKKPNKIKLTLLLLGSVLSLISLWLVIDCIVRAEDGVFLRQRAAVFVAVMALFPAVIALQMFLEEIEIQGFGYFILYNLILMFPAAFIASVLNRTQEKTTRDEDAK